MKTTIIGFPRVGSLRELKFASEKYFRKEITAQELQDTAKHFGIHTGICKRQAASHGSRQTIFRFMTICWIPQFC